MQILNNLGISDDIQIFVNRAESVLSAIFKSVEDTAEYNQYKVIDAFRQENIGQRHFAATTGYGYSDEGREALANVFACLTKAEKAVLSPHIASGTHAQSRWRCFPF